MPDPRALESLELSADEEFLLTSWQYRMIQRDIAGSQGKHLSSKRGVRDAFRIAAIKAIEQRAEEEWSSTVADVARQVIADDGTASIEVLESAGPELSSIVSQRSRALLLLIELYGFEPWDEGRWTKDVRAECLAEANQALTPLHQEDMHAIANAYRDAIKTLSRSGSWKKVALLAGAGLGVGVVTGGLAAPAIAGAYGTVVLGYSGAVATSAGMAALGGGSVAAGGLGMAGGAALITGVSGAVGAGAVTLGGKASGFTAARVAADAIRLHVVTQLVLRDVGGNEEAAKAVIVSLHERVANLGGTVTCLAERIDDLRNQLELAKAEVRAERAKRLSAEDRATRVLDLAGRLRKRASGVLDEELEGILSELQELERQRNAVTAVAEGVAALADGLEEAA